MTSDPGYIDLRLHEVERVYYDPRADFLASAALDEDNSATLAKRLMREAETIYNRARAFVVQRGAANMKQLAEVLRRMGA